jgi:hypothetical protein
VTTLDEKLRALYQENRFGDEWLEVIRAAARLALEEAADRFDGAEGEVSDAIRALSESLP